MTGRGVIDALLDAAKDWHSTLPEAAGFCPWPDDLIWGERTPIWLNAAEFVQTNPGATSPQSTALLHAVQQAAPHLHWRHGYSAEEVGQHFLDNFCWFELAGPDGHFLTQKTRITFGYWGPGLFYPRHHHIPEELYTVVSGQAVFHADGDADALLTPGQTRFHAVNQPHAMTTRDHPILTLVFWRGGALADGPSLSA